MRLLIRERVPGKSLRSEVNLLHGGGHREPSQKERRSSAYVRCPPARLKAGPAGGSGPRHSTAAARGRQMRVTTSPLATLYTWSVALSFKTVVLLSFMGPMAGKLGK